MICLTAKIYISGTEIIEINQRNLISMESSIFDRSDIKYPSFGIVSNTGNIKFNDTNGKVLDYAEQGALIEGLKCVIYLANDIVEEANRVVATMETSQWDYDNDNQIVTVTIKDDLEEWQDINVPNYPYDQRDITSKPLKIFYDYLYNITKENYNISSFEALEDDLTKDILQNTYIQYPLLKEASLWQQWTKLCEVCQLHIYKNRNGAVVCRYNRGN